MYIPKPYFSNIPQIGNLDLDYILMEDGYPILFTCKSRNSIYLCICRTLYPEQKWIISETNIELLRKMATRDISIKAAFKMWDGKSVIATWSKDNPREAYKVFSTTDLSDADLPPNSLYLNEDYAEDALDYLDGLLAEASMQAMLEIETQMEYDSHSVEESSSYYLTQQTGRVSIAYKSILGLESFLPDQMNIVLDTFCTGNIVRNNSQCINTSQANCDNAPANIPMIAVAA